MFICKFCEEEFESSKELKKHLKECDCNPENSHEENFHCRYCHQSFCTKEELRRHMLKCSNSDNVEEDS